MLRMVGFGDNIGSGFRKILNAWKTIGFPQADIHEDSYYIAGLKSNPLPRITKKKGCILILILFKIGYVSRIPFVEGFVGGKDVTDRDYVEGDERIIYLQELFYFLHAVKVRVECCPDTSET